MKTTWPARAGALCVLLSACAHHEASASPPAESAPAPARTEEPATAPTAAPETSTTPPSASTAAAVDLPKLVKAGATFLVDMEGTDARDTYLVHVDTLHHGMTWTWRMGESDSEPSGTVKTDEATLAKGAVVMFLTQGALVPSGKGAHATPPFLLSRAVARALRAGKKAQLSVLDVKNAVLAKDGTEDRTITVDGVVGSVSTIRATDGKTTAWFVDDPKWPVLVSLSFDGNDFADLKEVRTK